MAPITTRTGIPVLDTAFGGLYLKQPTLVTGRRKSGKSIVAIQFLAKTLLSGESAVMFTAREPSDITASLDSMDVDTGEALANNQLTIIPYASMERGGGGPFAALPFPQALDELGELVSSHPLAYAIFDSVVPWTAIEPVEDMPEHAEKFVSSLETMGLTSMLLLPKAASDAAQKLTNVLRELCPVNIEMEARNFGAEFVMRVTKFQGAQGVPLPWEKTLCLTPGVGFGLAQDPTQTTSQALADAATPPRRQTDAPKFRPMVKAGTVDFSAPPAGLGATQRGPGKAAFAPLAPVAAPVTFAAAPLAAAIGHDASAHRRQPMFSNVIDLPGLPPGFGVHDQQEGHQRAFQQEGHPIRLPLPANQNNATGRHIAFSKVIH